MKSLAWVLFPFERQIHRRGAKKDHEAERSPPGAVNRGEAGMLARLQYHIAGLPEQCVVRLNPVRSSGEFVSDRVAVSQDRDIRAVHRDKHFPEADVLS